MPVVTGIRPIKRDADQTQTSKRRTQGALGINVGPFVPPMSVSPFVYANKSANVHVSASAVHLHDAIKWCEVIGKRFYAATLGNPESGYASSVCHIFYGWVLRLQHYACINSHRGDGIPKKALSTTENDMLSSFIGYTIRAEHRLYLSTLIVMCQVRFVVQPKCGAQKYARTRRRQFFSHIRLWSLCSAYASTR